MEFYLKLIFVQPYEQQRYSLLYSFVFPHIPVYFEFFHGITTYILYHAQLKKKTPQFPTS